MLLNGGHALDGDGCDIAAVFALRDGDNDEFRWRPDRLGLVMGDIIEVSTFDCSAFLVAITSFILRVVTFLFFFDGDNIANVDNDGRFRVISNS